MCGIAGYIGEKNAWQSTIEMLKLLEYRGYDSAGIACLSGSKIENVKSKGNINFLEKKVANKPAAYCGIGHTRWATHGKPNVINAHPHVSQNKKWAVVHNGIIENYLELKSYLKKELNIKFSSQTDSEVIAQLLQCQKQTGIEKLINVCKKLKGSYAIASLCCDEEDTIYLAKKNSPLYVATNFKEVFVASDPICFSAKVEGYYSLNDEEFCLAQKGKIKFFNIDGKEISKKQAKMNDMDKEIDKKQFPHYMIKEIMETPNVLNNIVTTYKQQGIFKQIDKKFLSKINKIVLIGCGTAYHASLLGEKMIERFANVEARAYVASEFIYSKPIIDPKTLCILVSQSGETADTLKACEITKTYKCKTVALTNVSYSTLSKLVDIVLPVCAGKEIAVASTKAYSGQISILYMFAKHLENLKFNINFDYFSKIIEIKDKFSLPNQKTLKKLVTKLSKKNSAFFIGKGFDYITAEEASLKLKEISYINSTAYPSGELKHGFLALVEEGTIVFVIATQKNLLSKSLNSAFEVVARGGEIILVTNHEIDKNIKEIKEVITLPNLDEDVMPIVSIAFFQLLSYLVSVHKGINADQPRNLAKSVTVE